MRCWSLRAFSGKVDTDLGFTRDRQSTLPKSATADLGGFPQKTRPTKEARARFRFNPIGTRAIVVVAIGLALRGVALAADPRFPDWPCAQIKVPEISIAAVWAGPSIDDVGNAWEEDPTMRDYVARLSARRTSLDDAQKAISDFITGNAAERQKKAKLIFSGLFKTLNHERSEVMNGIERFFRQQKAFAENIRAETLQLRNLQDAADRDQGKADELANRIDWDTRIFEERRKTIGYVCEVPVLIEQRLFALARTIQQSLE